jgi:hypothetical protein
MDLATFNLQFSIEKASLCYTLRQKNGHSKHSLLGYLNSEALILSYKYNVPIILYKLYTTIEKLDEAGKRKEND